MIGKIDPLVQISNNKLEDIKTKQDTANTELTAIKSLTNASIGQAVTVGHGAGSTGYSRQITTPAANLHKVIVSIVGAFNNGDTIKLQIVSGATTYITDYRLYLNTTANPNYIVIDFGDRGVSDSSWGIDIATNSVAGITTHTTVFYSA